MAKKMSNIPIPKGDDSSSGPIDPNKGELLKVGPSDKMGATKDVQEAYGNPEKALDLMVAQESTWLLRYPKIAESGEKILELCLGNIEKIREYNFIYGFVMMGGPPSKQPEFRQNIESMAERSGINGKLLKELTSSYLTNTELEFRHIDVAVSILSSEKRYDSILMMAKSCVDQASKRGIGSGNYYLDKAADILEEHAGEYKGKDEYNVLLDEIAALAKKFRSPSLHREILKKRGRINDLITEGQEAYSRGHGLPIHEQFLIYDQAIKYMRTAGDEGIDIMKGWASENVDFRKEVKRLADAAYEKAAEKTGKEKGVYAAEAKFYDSLLQPLK